MEQTKLDHEDWKGGAQKRKAELTYGLFWPDYAKELCSWLEQICNHFSQSLTTPYETCSLFRNLKAMEIFGKILEVILNFT